MTGQEFTDAAALYTTTKLLVQDSVDALQTNEADANMKLHAFSRFARSGGNKPVVPDSQSHLCAQACLAC